MSATLLGTGNHEPNGAAPILRVDGLRKAFVRRGRIGRPRRSDGARTIALDDVSLTVARGEAVGIVGESGSGKTTLARAIVRLIEPDAGRIEFEGRSILDLKGRDLSRLRRRIQMVYQDPYTSLNPAMTVQQTILEPALFHGLIARAQSDAALQELMGQVGLDATLGARRPRELSGGQRQRVAIARALAAQPDVLIADEAVSALDVSIKAQIVELLVELQRRLNLTLIFVSHELATVAQVCARVAVMYRGQIVEIGPTDEVFRTPRHGYTVALMRAHPGQRRLVTAAGRESAALDPPSLDEPGCPFRHRCLFGREQCGQKTPDMVAAGPMRSARCFVLAALPAAEIQACIAAPDAAPQVLDNGKAENGRAPLE